MLKTHFCNFFTIEEYFHDLPCDLDSEWCVRNVLVWNEDDDILTDFAQCILWVVVTGIE